MPLLRMLPLPAALQPSSGGLTLLDEVVFANVTVHIERMDETYYWVGITEPDGETLHFGFEAKNPAQLEFAFAADSSDNWAAPAKDAPPLTLPGTPPPGAPGAPTAAGDLTWVFSGPPEADPAAAAAVLAGFGFQFHPEKDQIALGEDYGGYARSGDAESIKTAFQDACAAANIPWPQGRPAWAELNYSQRQAVLRFLAESPSWCEDGDLAKYAEDIMNDYGGRELLFE